MEVSSRHWARAAVCALLAAASGAQAACRGTVYLTFDTGSQAYAGYVADLLRRHQVKATFFVASEKTVQGDHSLDASWAPYWKQLAEEGHAFGSHTFDHVYFVRELADGKLLVKPSQGPQAGQPQRWSAEQYCAEIRRADERFQQLTGRKLDPFWRAPGGKTSPRAEAIAERCGYRHAGWTPNGFLGDELASERYSNRQLLERALSRVGPSDVLMAHLGIWSRKDPFAPMLDPLIAGLKAKGLCFATLREHPALSAPLARSAS
jgi:peptidoglycan/xylan/chitin deacetylase (PgdA/CDA1 family)